MLIPREARQVENNWAYLSFPTSEQNNHQLTILLTPKSIQEVTQLIKKNPANREELLPTFVLN